MSRASVVAALSAGMALAVLDLALSPLHPGVVSEGGVGGRLALLALIPGVTTLVGLVVAWLPAPVALVVPAACAFWLGDRMAQGNRASRMLFAGAWSWLLAAGTFAGGLLLARRAAGGRRRGEALAWLAAGVAVYLVAAFVQRGRYHEVRLAAVGLAAVALHVGFLRALPRPSARTFAAALLLGAAALGGGAWAAARSVDAVQWALARGSASSALVSAWRRSLSAEPDGPPALDLKVPPLLGTERARRARARLGECDGVLLITIDALRADLFGKKAGGRPIAPWLDAQRQRSFVFERAYCAAATSQISLFSLFSGRYPSQVVSYDGGFNRVPLVTARLNRAGVHTRGCFTTGLFTHRGEDFSRDALDFAESTRHRWLDLGVEKTLEAIRPKRSPWFSWVHILLPHYPYDHADEGFRAGDSEFERYAAEVRQADDWTRQIIERLEHEGHFDRGALVVVSADHGEEFREHGGTRHGAQLWEEVVHVPLLVWGRGVRPGRHPRPVSLVDLASTLEHVFRLPAEGRPPLAGRSLLPLLVGVEDGDRRDEILCENPPLGSAVHQVNAAVVGPRWKFLRDERLQLDYLFDLDADPGETENLAASRPGVVEHHRALMGGLRRLVGYDPALFEELDAAGLLVKRGERLSPGELYELLIRHPDVPPAVVAKMLCDFAIDGHPLLARGLARAFEETDDPLVRDAISVLRVAHRLAKPAVLDELVGRYDRIRDPHVAGTLLWVLAVSEDARLRGRDLPPAVAGHPVARLGRALHRALVDGEAADPALVEDVLGNGSPFERRRAADLVGRARVTTVYDALKAAHRSAADDDRLRAALVSALAVQDHPDVDELLAARARRGRRSECEEALAGLALRQVVSADFAGRPAWHRDHHASTRGLGPADGWFCPLVEKRAALPVKLFEEGTLVGLFIRFLERGQGWPALEVGAGEWSVLVKDPPLQPHRPTVLRVPPGVAAEELSLTLVAGPTKAVLVSGTVSLRCANEPPGALAMHR